MSERTNANFRRWYKRHRKTYLSERRRRRKSDPAFRDALADSATKYRDQHKDEINAERRERMESDPDFRAAQQAYAVEFRERIANGHIPDVRPLYVGTDRVYRQSETARMAGCSDAAIIKWIRAGWIPEPDRIGTRRVFTATQISLISWFASIRAHDHEARSNASKIIFKNWNTAGIGGCNL